MEFPRFNFEDLNETDVREEIIAPLLRELGYRSGTDNDVIREQTLKYPRSFLGHKKNNDPILRGKADYICETKNKTRWVIEAKAPTVPIDDPDTIEQVWTYANHAEIRSVYFCICNGSNFSIYQTNKGPIVDPVFQCSYEEMKDELVTIKGILGPLAISRDYKTYVPDYGEPLAPHLRSFAQLTNGKIIYEKNSLKLRPFEGMVMTILDGTVERTDTKKIEAYIKTQVPYQKLQDLNEKLGLHEFSLQTDDRTISMQSDTPTIFTGSNQVILPSGTTVLDLTTWKEEVLPINISVSSQVTAAGFLEAHTFSGSFTSTLRYEEINIEIRLDGKFSAQIN